VKSLECSRCCHILTCESKNRYVATCPHRKTTISIRKNQVVLPAGPSLETSCPVRTDLLTWLFWINLPVYEVLPNTMLFHRFVCQHILQLYWLLWCLLLPFLLVLIHPSIQSCICLLPITCSRPVNHIFRETPHYSRNSILEFRCICVCRPYYWSNLKINETNLMNWHTIPMLI